MRVCFECQCCYDDSEDYCTEEGHPVLSQIRDGSPDIAQGYRLDFLLDSGIKGESYLAHQTESGGSCLIRILSADVENSRQFLSNAELAAAFFHPGVVDVYEAGHLKTGEVFVVSENPHGDTLREMLDYQRVPDLLTTIQVIRQAAEALDALHSQGLTHGAVNPENIVLTTDAQNRLLVRLKDIDFGGVTGRSVMANKFLIDSALNLLKYFAPEQCSGSGPGKQADIYSLGIVLHEMLAGAPPFNASKAVGLIEQHRKQRPPEIRIDNFDLRMLLTHTLAEALQKQPELRQRSANAFARQMRHIEQLKTHAAIPPPAGVTRPEPARSAAVFTSSTDPARFVAPPLSTSIEEPEASREDITLPAVEMAELVSDKSAELAHPIPEVIPTSPAKTLPVIDALQIDEPIVYEPDEEETLATPRRSRMKSLTGKLSSLARALPKMRANRSGLIVGTAQQKLAALRSTLTEISSIESELAKAAFDRAHKAPTRIEWETPEDDIPSEADALAALSDKPTPVAPLIEAEPATPAADGAAIKIKWEQIEDDIPLVADVVEILAAEPDTEFPIIEAEAATIAEVPSNVEAVVLEPKAVAASEVKRRPISEVIPDTDQVSASSKPDIQGHETSPKVLVVGTENAYLDPRRSRLTALTEKLWARAPLPKIWVSEPVSLFESSYDPAPLESPAAQPQPQVEAPIEPRASRLSQLKALAEKLQSMAPALPTFRAREDIHIVGPSYQLRSTPDEIPSVRPESVKAEVEAPVFERAAASPEPVHVFQIESEPIPVIAAETSAHGLPAEHDLLIEEPLVQNQAVQFELIAPRHSRLKALKRKLRALAPPARERNVGAEKDTVTKISHRSRLKLLKKKLRSMMPPPQLARLEERAEPGAPRRSRLKLLKRKLRSMVPPVPLVAVGEVLPTVEPAIENLAPALVETTKTQFVEAQQGKETVISTIIRPTMIDWAESDEGMLAEAEIPEVSMVEAPAEIPAVQVKPEETPIIPVDKKPALVNAESKPAAPPVFLTGKYIWPRRPQRVKPLPVVGEAAAKSSTVGSDRRGPLFSSPYSGSRGRRSAMMVGGLVVLLALGFVGRLVLSSGATPEVQRAAVSNPPVQRTLPRSIKPYIEEPSVKTVRQPETSPREEVVASLLKMPPSKGPASAKASMADRDTDDDPVVRDRKQRSALVSRNYGAMGTPLMSTLVISYGNGKVTTSVEPYRQNSVDSKRVSIPSRLTEPSRPRVVKGSNDDK